MEPAGKGSSTAKPKKADPILAEILSGVDIIGTMLHLDLPRLEGQLSEIKALVSSASPGQRAARPDTTEAAALLEEIKEMVQVQGEQLLALERRLAHLTSLCEDGQANRKESS